jgi:hypothetical protein
LQPLELKPATAQSGGQQLSASAADTAAAVEAAASHQSPDLARKYRRAKQLLQAQAGEVQRLRGQLAACAPAAATAASPLRHASSAADRGSAIASPDASSPSAAEASACRPASSAAAAMSAAAAAAGVTPSPRHYAELVTALRADNADLSAVLAAARRAALDLEAQADAARTREAEHHARAAGACAARAEAEAEVAAQRAAAAALEARLAAQRRGLKHAEERLGQVRVNGSLVGWDGSRKKKVCWNNNRLLPLPPPQHSLTVKTIPRPPRPAGGRRDAAVGRAPARQAAPGGPPVRTGL